MGYPDYIVAPSRSAFYTSAVLPSKITYLLIQRQRTLDIYIDITPCWLVGVASVILSSTSLELTSLNLIRNSFCHKEM